MPSSPLEKWFENPGDPRGRWKMHLLKDNWVNANQVIVADLNKDGSVTFDELFSSAGALFLRLGRTPVVPEPEEVRDLAPLRYAAAPKP